MNMRYLACPSPCRRKSNQVNPLIAFTSPRGASDISPVASIATDVSRVLMGLMRRGFDSIARVGSHRRTHKSLLGCVVHSSCGRDAQKVSATVRRRIFF